MGKLQPPIQPSKGGFTLNCHVCLKVIAVVKGLDEGLGIILPHGLSEHPLHYPYSCAICANYKGTLPLTTEIYSHPPDCELGKDVEYGAICPMLSPKEK